MTTAVRPRELWNTMPGWGIVANLIPPELLLARKLRLLRRILGLGLAMVVLLAVTAFGWAWMQHQTAEQDLRAVQNQTSQLKVEQNRFQAAVKVQGSITQIDGQLKTLMANDVDFAAVLGNIRAQLPASMTIGQLALTINQTPNGASGEGGAALDATGSQHIGVVTVSGRASGLADLSAFIDKLRTVPGVVEPYPVSNATGNDGSVNYSLQLTLTAALLTHAYDHPRDGGK